MTTRNVRLAAAAAVLALGGCGQRGPETHPVAGRVDFPGGDVGRLAGHLVEFVREDDPLARASGVIEPDGRFALQTLDAGELRRGAKPGRYLARLVIVDEGDGRPAKPGVARRFLDHKTAGWAVSVPAAGDVTLTAAAK